MDTGHDPTPEMTHASGRAAQARPAMPQAASTLLNTDLNCLQRVHPAHAAANSVASPPIAGSVTIYIYLYARVYALLVRYIACNFLAALGAGRALCTSYWRLGGEVMMHCSMCNTSSSAFAVMHSLEFARGRTPAQQDLLCPQVRGCRRPS